MPIFDQPHRDAYTPGGAGFSYWANTARLARAGIKCRQKAYFF